MADDFGVVLEGVPQFNAALTKVILQQDVASRAFVAGGAHLIEAAAKKNFEGSHPKGQPHVGGSKPNVVTGNLRRSIRTFGPTRAGADWVAMIGPTAVYGRAVELGLHQAPDVSYPYMVPAFEATLPAVRALWVDSARKALNV